MSDCTLHMYFSPHNLKINTVIYAKPLNFTLKWVNCMAYELYLNKV